MKSNTNAHRRATPSRGPRFYYLAALFALLLVPVTSLQALPNDKDQPIEIEADGVDINEGKGYSTYHGNVIVRQGTTVLKADKVTVYQESRKAKRIVANGKPARFSQRPGDNKPQINAQALQIEYDASSEELVLTKKAKMTQGKDSFSSDRIVYDRKRATLKAGATAKGKQRVHVTMDPAIK